MKILKLSFFFLVFILIIFGVFFSLQTWDAQVEIRYDQYIVYINILFLITLFLFLQIILWTGIYIVFLPSLLIKKTILKSKKNKEKSLIKKVLALSHDMLLGKNSEASKIIPGLLNNSLPEEIEEHLRLLFLKLNVGFNIKLHYLQSMLRESEQYKFFIARDLSQAALNEKSYHYSLELATIAFNINNKDPKLLELLIDVYVELESWNKMEEAIRLLVSIDKISIIKIKEKISNCYIKAAKQFIGLGQSQNVIYYLKKCLEYKPDSIICIELISQIQTELKSISLQKVIENAFAISPCFKLFKIYYQNYKNSMSSEEMYYTLTKDVSKEDYPGLLIAIAYFLNIKTELDSIVLTFI